MKREPAALGVNEKILLQKAELVEAQTGRCMKTTNRVVIWTIKVRSLKQINSVPIYQTPSYTYSRISSSGGRECRSLGMKGKAVPQGLAMPRRNSE